MPNWKATEKYIFEKKGENVAKKEKEMLLGGSDARLRAQTPSDPAEAGWPHTQKVPGQQKKPCLGKKKKQKTKEKKQTSKQKNHNINKKWYPLK